MLYLRVSLENVKNGSFFLVQSYVYLAFVSLVVAYTRHAVINIGVSGFLLYPLAFFVVMYPVFLELGRARADDREAEHANPQVESLHLTVLIAFISFFIFAIAPDVMQFAWGWVS